MHIAEKIIKFAQSLFEGQPVTAKMLLHLGSRSGVDQALSRLTRRGQLLRIARGLYVLPVKGRFGTRAPSTEKVVEGVAQLRGEVIVQHAAASANTLGLTTQVPIRASYLSSGHRRLSLKLGQLSVEVVPAPRWQVGLLRSPVGPLIRALDWLGQAHAGAAVRRLSSTLTKANRLALAQTPKKPIPSWLVHHLNQLACV